MNYESCTQNWKNVRIIYLLPWESWRIYWEYLPCMQCNASGSFLQKCINFVEQQLKFSHFEGSIIPYKWQDTAISSFISCCFTLAHIVLQLVTTSRLFEKRYLQTVQAPLFSQFPTIYWFFCEPLLKIGFFSESP